MSSRVPLRVRKLQKWPGEPRGFNVAGRFRTSPAECLADLERELSLHDAHSAWIELDVTERDLKHDDSLRADARPAMPGVVLYFEHPRKGTLRIACDTYDEWHHNVRAIHMTLRDLRSIDRHGAVQNEAQFEGFKAIPAATGLTMGVTTALSEIAKAAGYASAPAPNDVTQDWLDTAIRRARGKMHPDVGGSRAAWDLVEAAARVVRMIFTKPSGTP